MTRRPRTAPRTRSSLGSWWDDLAQQINGGQSQEGACVAQASAAVAPFDAKIDDLAANWRPTGFYLPADLRATISSVMAMVNQAQAAVNQAAAEPNALQDTVMRASSDLSRAGSRSLDFIAAANQADAQGARVVNAQGFKDWVLDTMVTCSAALEAASTIGCVAPWWVGVLATFQSAFDQTWTVVRALAGVVADVGEKVITVATNLDTIIEVALWGGAALGVVWLYGQLTGKRVLGGVL
jgi:flagellar biosynthesis regulator FlaF